MKKCSRTNFLDVGDYGQDVIASDASCAQMFGDDQDIGSFRSQSLRSGGGKILRLDPRTGQGICQGNDRFGVANPSATATSILGPQRLGLLVLANLSV